MKVFPAQVSLWPYDLNAGTSYKTTWLERKSTKANVVWSQCTTHCNNDVTVEYNVRLLWWPGTNHEHVRVILWKKVKYKYPRSLQFKITPLTWILWYFYMNFLKPLSPICLRPHALGALMLHNHLSQGHHLSQNQNCPSRTDNGYCISRWLCHTP